MEKLAILVLAAGLGKRMGSEEPKVLARSIEKTLIEHVLATASELSPERIIVITGHKRELVESQVQSGTGYDKKAISFVLQASQRGTGDAVRSALPALKDFSGTVLILYGDVPLVRPDTLKRFLTLHRSEKATISIITAITSAANSYGRIIRDQNSDKVLRIVEAKDATPRELAVSELNSGIYAADVDFLNWAISKLDNKNAQGEYYLTDIVGLACGQNKTIATLVLQDVNEVQGVNTRQDLALINAALRERVVSEHIGNGVLFADPGSCLVDRSVQIGAGAEIGPQVQLLGKTSVGAGTKIEGSAWIMDSTIGDNCHLKLGLRLERARLGNQVSVGPFPHLRPETDLADQVKIGNFVETKKAKLARGAKANHLTYLGDCTIGEDSNVGAGTITCNYDGFSKSETVLGRDVFIGSNTALVAPVTIADGAVIGAGSTITKNVEKDALAFTRAPQVSKAGWAKRRRETKAS